MGKKANKASRKYAASGQLKKEIQSRKKHQQIKRKIERRKVGKATRGKREGSEDAELVRDINEMDEGDDVERAAAGSDDEEMSDGETGK